MPVLKGSGCICLLMTMLFVCLVLFVFAQPGQLNISRVELMPDEPQPYVMRDWHDVATGYDTFVYRTDAVGEHLPLIFIYDNGINYPGNNSFGLDSYVGTFSNNAGEAINVLPSLVGASLVGIDKSNQFGMNWILYSQDYFNRANGELIYLNNRGGSSGGDWWYDMMPNIYFLQLYDLYGNIGDAQYQFISIADRFAEAVRGLGGSDTPWKRANMNHRAWDFVEMEPNDTSVPEPEAAGAFAWVLYHAYNETHNPEYLKAAEWSMEFLSNLGANPSYELQLPYGCFIAAKMNAELGTKYDLEKLMFWVFNRGPLRGWGTIVDNWGGVDVSGLVGEANENGNDYAFQMNAVQHAAALVPMVRYDKRYARTIGKWVLNMANATRLMYPGFLPSDRQDASTWSQVNDPKSVVGYEALRETLDGKSPFSTGDALVNGWAATNLALYGTSSIGYLGGMLQKTDVEKILLIDLLKTDFFHAPAYPTYLVYNPYATEKTITVDLGDAPVDVYDALTESLILQNISAQVQVSIPADQARLLVYIPVGSTISYEDNKLLRDGVVIDYMQSAQAYNFHPRIQSLAVLNQVVEFGDTIQLFAQTIDHETKETDLDILWFTSGGEIIDSGKTASYVVPDFEFDDVIRVIVVDEADQRDTATITLMVRSEVNIAPQILNISTDRIFTKPNTTISIHSDAIDLNMDPLSYDWSASSGQVSGDAPSVQWTSPATEGIYRIDVVVSDDAGASAEASIDILVRDFGLLPEADLIAYYPFSGNANDESGNGLHGAASGAKLTADFEGALNSAYFFDGINDRINVSNESILNFQNGITVSCEFQPQALPARESFILSHGSWHNRWKISITPEKKLRWTLKNTTGSVIDIDSRLVLQQDSVYHLAATYDGSHLILFLNGHMESFRALTGPINMSPVDFLMGQILPDDPNYNFRGVLDELRIYNMALSPNRIGDLAGVISSIENPVSGREEELLVKAFPNPVDGKLFVQRIDDQESELLNIHVYHAGTGKVLLKQNLAGHAGHVDLRGFVSGIYYMLIFSKQERQTIMIYVQ